MDKIITIYQPAGSKTSLKLKSGRYKIGSGLFSDIKLSGKDIKSNHAVMTVLDEDIAITAQSGVSFEVNGELVSQYEGIILNDIIRIGSYKLIVEPVGGSKKDSAASGLDHRGTKASSSTQKDSNGTAASSGLSESAAHDSTALVASPAAKLDKSIEELIILKAKIQEKVLDNIDLYQRAVVEQVSDSELKTTVKDEALKVIRLDDSLQIPKGIDIQKLATDIAKEAVGLGLLEDLMVDDAVSEVMINGPTQIYIEREGKLTLSEAVFSSERSLLNVLERIVTPLGRRIDESSPMVDARLPDGSRVNAIIPPLSLVGPVLTIRKFSKSRLTLNKLVEYKAITPDILEFLVVCVKSRKNIIVSGGTGTGKTTFLNALSDYIPEGERLITVEDSAELQLAQDHVISLETRPPNTEGKGQVEIRDLVKNALRMRPDRILVGECRGGEALDMLQAMNTGHEGSMTTAHANSPRDMISRVEVMTLMAGMDLPLRVVREQISRAVDIIVQLTRFRDGSRKISSIVEITGIEGEMISMQEIFNFEVEGYSADRRLSGRHRPTGIIPDFYKTLIKSGENLNTAIFTNGKNGV